MDCIIEVTALSLRELIWICLFVSATVVAVKATVFAPPCPVITELNPSVRSYIDGKIPTDAAPADYDKLRGRLAALEARLNEVQKISADNAQLEAKQKQVELLLKEIREQTLKTMDERRSTELQWLKANISMKCAGFTVKSATGKNISVPPLPADLSGTTPAKATLPATGVLAPAPTPQKPSVPQLGNAPIAPPKVPKPETHGAPGSNAPTPNHP
jgi:hypothetical protein